MIEKKQKTANLAKLTLTTWFGTKTFKLISSNKKNVSKCIQFQNVSNLIQLFLNFLKNLI